MATIIVRHYYRNNWQLKFRQLLVQIQGYLIPIRSGRKDKRKLRAKRAIDFVYRVA